MEFTGERYVPGEQGLEELYVEHMSRYVFAGDIAVGRRVLDLGCGCGYGAHYMAIRGASLVVGIDSSEEAVDFAASHYSHPRLRFAVMDACGLSVRQGFDLVTCFEVIEHVSNAPGVLEEARHVLDHGGVFLVSTPNKLTYVAGGPDGTNPFHFREYFREEFEGLLKGIFPYVVMFGQRWVEGIALSRYPAHSEDRPSRAIVLPDESGLPPPGFDQGEPPYFIALCAMQDILDGITCQITPVVMHALTTRYDRLKSVAIRLQDEFDERGRWAERVARENQAKSDEIKRLQGEAETLRNDFDERGEWAQELNQELARLRATVTRLTQENARLRSGREAASPNARR